MPLDTAATIDTTTWAALALVLTALGAVWTWRAWRRRGAAAGLRSLAWTLVPIAAWLTGTLRLVAGIVDDVAGWAARLVFSPAVWAGVVVAGAAVALWVVSGIMRSRGIGVREPRGGAPSRPRQVRPAPAADAKQAAPAARQGDREDLDDMDEIEAILKRHGI
jgi:hypothetical protein